MQFYIHGKEARFRFGEISNLKRLVISANLPDPLAVYWSRKAIVACVSALDRRHRKDGTAEHINEARFMRKVYDLLNKTEHSSQQKKRGLQTTQEIDTDISLDIIYDSQRHRSKVVEVTPKYIAIAHPRVFGYHGPIEFVDNASVDIHFWRKDDSGYMVKTRLTRVHGTSADILHIRHTREITRVQARTFARKTIRTPGTLFLIADPEADTSEQNGGLKCHVLNISEGGASIVVGGKVSNQTGFKVEIPFRDSHITMVTRLISTQYHADKNISLLGLEAVSVDIAMRNRISALVYDINADTDEQSLAPQ